MGIRRGQPGRPGDPGWIEIELLDDGVPLTGDAGWATATSSSPSQLSAGEGFEGTDDVFRDGPGGGRRPALWLGVFAAAVLLIGGVAWNAARTSTDEASSDSAVPTTSVAGGPTTTDDTGPSSTLATSWTVPELALYPDDPNAPVLYLVDTTVFRRVFTVDLATGFIDEMEDAPATSGQILGAIETVDGVRIVRSRGMHHQIAPSSPEVYWRVSGEGTVDLVTTVSDRTIRTYESPWGLPYSSFAGTTAGGEAVFSGPDNRLYAMSAGGALRRVSESRTSWSIRQGSFISTVCETASSCLLRLTTPVGTADLGTDAASLMGYTVSPDGVWGLLSTTGDLDGSQLVDVRSGEWTRLQVGQLMLELWGDYGPLHVTPWTPDSRFAIVADAGGDLEIIEPAGSRITDVSLPAGIPTVAILGAFG